MRKAVRLIDVSVLGDHDTLTMVNLHREMACLQQYQDSLHLSDIVTEANTKYPILDLVNAFCLSELVKNDERPRTVCHFALRLSLPKALAGVFSDRVLQGKNLG